MAIRVDEVSLHFSFYPPVNRLPDGYNKRDMPDIVSIRKIQQLIDMQDRPVFESVAVRGVGVIESLNEVTRLMLAKHRRGGRPPAAN